MKAEILSLLLNHISVIIGFCLGFWLVARVLRQHLRPSVSIAWLLSIILIPYVGVPVYFLFGGRKLASRAGRKKGLYPESTPPGSGNKSVETSGLDPLECVMLAAGMPPSRHGGRIEFIADGKEAYTTLLRLIGEAKQSIHVMTFILGHDEVGRSVVEQLTVKANEGVKVRLLLDALGCLTTRGYFVRKLRRAGGMVGVFSPVLPLRRKWSANLRNHRKMIIIDGKTALIGGMNLGKEYMGPNSDPKRWLDTTLLVEGPALQDMEEIFANDWNYATKEAQWIPKSDAPTPVENPSAPSDPSAPSAQIAASGPDVADDPIHDAILTGCMEAKKRIWIVTPYFIPDESISRAILLQARLGRDVRVLIPKKSNHSLADLARGPFLRRMKECGVKIHLYPVGMIHAKHMILDDNVVLAGSMNLDLRSLYLNYEIGVFIRSRQDIQVVADWAQSLMDRSEDFVETEVGRVKGWMEDLSVLVSPLL